METVPVPVASIVVSLPSPLVSITPRLPDEPPPKDFPVREILPLTA